MRICDDLRQAVLQAAIQGKLTKQLPEDGNAADLLKQIKDEKEKLIKEKKINREKEMSLQKSKRDKGFNIPDNWAWAHFGEITINLDSVRVPIEKSIREKQKNKIYDYYGASGIIDKVEDYLFDKRLLLIGEDGANLLARSTPIAFIAEGKYWVNNHAHVLDVGKYLFLDYICLYINSIDLSYYVTGTAQPKMNQANMNSIWVSIPPLAEQHRIVVKVEELMVRIDDLEKTETELEKLKAAFPGDMKAALLQAAMQGKLTEQLPEDGDAANLLNQITKEKNQLIKEGKIKKEKPLPDITPDEVPFDIPENWKWVKLGDLCSKIGSGNTPSGGKNSDVYVQKGVKFIRSMNVYNDGLHYYGIVFISEELAKTRVGSLVYAKDILLNITGGSIGRCALIPDDFDLGSVNQHVLIVRNIYDSLRQYIHICICSPLVQENILKKAVGDKAGFSAEKAKNLLIPLPPLAEQKRIVEKLDKLLPLCDGLVEE